MPWLGGSGGWSVISYTKKLWVQSLVRAHTQVVVLTPGWGAYRSQPTDVLLSRRCFSLSLSLSPAPSSLSKTNAKHMLGWVLKKIKNLHMCHNMVALSSSNLGPSLAGSFPLNDAPNYTGIYGLPSEPKYPGKGKVPLQLFLNLECPRLSPCTSVRGVLALLGSCYSDSSQHPHNSISRPTAFSSSWNETSPSYAH